ncbi:MAG: nitrate reductase molybdenum cofactor assembly chaperone [Ardenticatenaceae bacterium]|nr:nitrate reductase molybdenum cofactor assembly chaperone [Ardenticatenaceae bacterium]
MMAVEYSERRLFQLFAELLDYPKSDLTDAVRECVACVAVHSAEAATLFREFEVLVSETSLGRLQEIYSGVFDLDAACHPYVGYHLFGESYKRSVFLLELKKRYRAAGLVAENELPDHLAVLLRFLAITDDATLASEIVHEALLAALDRMTGKAKSAGYDEQESVETDDSQKQRHPYRGVLEAMRLVLQSFPANNQGATTEGAGSVTEDGELVASRSPRVG